MLQSASWYAGLIQIGALTLTLVIYALTYRRLKYKKRMERLGKVSYWKSEERRWTDSVFAGNEIHL